MTEVREIDLVFLCDCTGSMGSYIAEAQKSIKSIITTLQASEKADLRFALICYRDHPPQDMTYVTKVFPFTDSVKSAQENVDTMSASGGGDGPECIACAMKDILGLDFRKEALKVVVMISDAPPHGLTRSGDGFPDGCPDKNDPMEITKTLKERGIICYTVGVEPSVTYGMTREWLRALAKITGGRYVPLSGASSLPDVILYGTTEELDLKKLEGQIAEEEAAIRKEFGADAAEDKVDAELEARLQKKGVEIRRLDVKGFDESVNKEQVDELTKRMSMMAVQSYVAEVSKPMVYSFGASIPASAPYGMPPVPSAAPIPCASPSSMAYAPAASYAPVMSPGYGPPSFSPAASYAPAMSSGYGPPSSSPYSMPLSSPAPAPTMRSAYSPFGSATTTAAPTTSATPFSSVPAAPPATSSPFGAAPIPSRPVASSSSYSPFAPSSSSYGYAQVQSSVSISDIRKVKSRITSVPSSSS